MTDFGFWQKQANDAGLVMCALCFDMLNPSLMNQLEDGSIEDVCIYCKAIEDMELDRRRELEAQYGI